MLVGEGAGYGPQSQVGQGLLEQPKPMKGDIDKQTDYYVLWFGTDPGSVIHWTTLLSAETILPTCSTGGSVLLLHQLSVYVSLSHPRTASWYISFSGQRRPPTTVSQILPEHDDDKLKHPTGQAVCLASSFPPFRPHHPVRYVCPSLKKAQQAAFAWCLCSCSHLALCLL